MCRAPSKYSVSSLPFPSIVTVPGPFLAASTAGAEALPDCAGETRSRLGSGSVRGARHTVRPARRRATAAPRFPLGVTVVLHRSLVVAGCAADTGEEGRVEACFRAVAAGW